jgi:hypothetical protein
MPEAGSPVVECDEVDGLAELEDDADLAAPIVIVGEQLVEVVALAELIGSRRVETVGRRISAGRRAGRGSRDRVAR